MKIPSNECLFGDSIFLDRGLVVKQPWVDLILCGEKTWEIRGSRTNIRGRIGIIESGTGLVVGYTTLVDCIGPLTLSQMYSNITKHCVGQDDAFIKERLTINNQPFYSKTQITYASKMPYPKTYAWVLESARWLTKPIEYSHPPGAIIWVKL